MQEVQLTCFQSYNQEAIEIPLEIAYTPNISIDCLQVRFHFIEKNNKKKRFLIKFKKN